jgi:dienelactone hydrolase
MKQFLTMLLLGAVLAAPALAEVQTEAVTYKDGDTELEGFLAFDDSKEGAQPAVLIVHEWWGLTQHAKDSAEKLAGLGYTAFALDMYGKGKYTDDPAQAKEWSSAIKSDHVKMIKRLKAGMDVVRTNEHANEDRMAAIGYCFGGSMVLEMARLGFAFEGVVSFHGGLASTLPDEVDPNLTPSILVCHGGDDPFVSAEEVSAFKQEMRDNNANWQFITYGNAVHSFTNPAADGALSGAKYDETAAKRSWEHMKQFFNEIFE